MSTLAVGGGLSCVPSATVDLVKIESGTKPMQKIYIRRKEGRTECQQVLNGRILATT